MKRHQGMEFSGKLVGFRHRHALRGAYPEEHPHSNTIERSLCWAIAIILMSLKQGSGFHHGNCKDYWVYCQVFRSQAALLGDGNLRYRRLPMEPIPLQSFYRSKPGLVLSCCGHHNIIDAGVMTVRGWGSSVIIRYIII